MKRKVILTKTRKDYAYLGDPSDTIQNHSYRNSVVLGFLIGATLALSYIAIIYRG